MAEEHKSADEGVRELEKAIESVTYQVVSAGPGGVTLKPLTEPPTDVELSKVLGELDGIAAERAAAAEQIGVNRAQFKESFDAILAGLSALPAK